MAMTGNDKKKYTGNTISSRGENLMRKLMKNMGYFKI